MQAYKRSREVAKKAGLSFHLETDLNVSRDTYIGTFHYTSFKNCELKLHVPNYKDLTWNWIYYARWSCYF
jgi:hypothetical protein